MLGLSGKPRILDWTKQTVNPGTTLTLEFPKAGRAAGNGVIAFISHPGGGPTTPSTPSGFTSLASASAAPGYRIAYKRLLGTEGLTVTSTWTGSSDATGIMIAMSGVQFSAVAPVHGGAATATSTTPNPGSVATTLNGRRLMWLAYGMVAGAADFIGWPGDTIWNLQLRLNNSGIGIALTTPGALLTKDFSAFTLSASVANRAGAIAIPAFV